MKKRILALILTLMLALTLLPAGVLADGDIYVSVGGKEFTAFDQTVKVGGGTATLTEKNGNAYLTMDSVKLTSFDNLGSEDGVTYYAGICYDGDNRLIVRCTNCSITAPQHGDNAIYEGIYVTESAFMLHIEGDRTIKNTDYGIDAPAISVNASSLNVSTVGGDAILTEEFYVLSNGVLNLSSVGYSTVTAGLVSIANGENAPAVNVSLTADNRYGYGSSVALYATNISTARALNVSVNADFSGYTGDDVLLCGGILSENLQLSAYSGDVNHRISSSMNVKGSDNLAITGIYTQRLNAEYGNNALSGKLNISGKHAGAIGIYCEDISSASEMTLESEIKGAVESDIALVLLTEDGKDFTAGEIYASTDCKSGVAMLLLPGTDIVSAEGKALTVQTPKNGSIQTFADEELPVIGSDVPESINTVVDENGEPASTVVMNSRDSAFRDIDIPSQKNFKPAILWAVDNGITAGVTPVEFRPLNPCTRGQVVSFLWRAAGMPEPTTTENPFSDVKESAYYYKAILWAAENNVTSGYSDGTFRPGATVTRAQFVTFLWRYLGSPAPKSTDNPFNDVKQNGFYNAILWGSENGIVAGYKNADGTMSFRPNNPCTRAHVAAFLWRAMAS